MSALALPEFRRFNFYTEITKSHANEKGDWVVEGPLSNPDADLQGESMSMDGLRKGLKVYETLGKNVDWEHMYRRTLDPAYLIGKGLEIFDDKHPKTGHVVPFLRTRIWNDPKLKPIGQHAINHLQVGGTLGYSVEGGAIRKAGGSIPEPIITMVTMTPQPVVSENAGTIRVLKSMIAAAGNWGVEFPVLPQLLAPMGEEEFTQTLLKALVEYREIEKSMDAGGAMPHSGPGVSAAEVEDLGGGKRKKDEETCPDCDRPKDECRCADLEKALAFQLSEELHERLLMAA